MTQKSSYGQILKSSSIMGGAAGINLLLGMMLNTADGRLCVSNPAQSK